jgi:ribosomal protein S18 acetylase RimI-like enzyme
VDIAIRPLAAGDAAAFRQLRLQAIADAPSAIWPTHDEEAGRTDADVEARIRHTDTQVVFGAFVDGALAGIAGLRREPLRQVRHKALLWGVFVIPGQRRRGLARLLFARIAAHARATDVLQIHLCVNAANDRARALYRSLAFETYGVEPRAMRVGERWFDEELMVLRLDAA